MNNIESYQKTNNDGLHATRSSKLNSNVRLTSTQTISYTPSTLSQTQDEFPQRKPQYRTNYGIHAYLCVRTKFPRRIIPITLPLSLSHSLASRNLIHARAAFSRISEIETLPASVFQSHYTKYQKTAAAGAALSFQSLSRGATAALALRITVFKANV